MFSLTARSSAAQPAQSIVRAPELGPLGESVDHLAPPDDRRRQQELGELVDQARIVERHARDRIIGQPAGGDRHDGMRLDDQALVWLIELEPGDRVAEDVAVQVDAR